MKDNKIKRRGGSQQLLLIVLKSCAQIFDGHVTRARDYYGWRHVVRKLFVEVQQHVVQRETRHNKIFAMTHVFK